MDTTDIINSLIDPKDINGLNEYEKRVCVLNEFESECINGGWNQYFWNSAGNNAILIESYAEEFGYIGICEAIRKVKELMGGDIPVDRDKRVKLLESILSDEKTDELITNMIDRELNDVYSDICAYVEKNREHFKYA